MLVYRGREIKDINELDTKLYLLEWECAQNEIDSCYVQVCMNMKTLQKEGNFIGNLEVLSSVIHKEAKLELFDIDIPMLRNITYDISDCDIPNVQDWWREYYTFLDRNATWEFPVLEENIGNLRTALYSYLFAKHNKGEFILRIDDTDKEREVVGGKEYIIHILKEIGLKYDELYVQSERLEIYKTYAKELVERGGAYYCQCDRNEVCSCREKGLTSGIIRQRIERERVVVVEDELHGRIEIDTNILDDPVLIKSDGYPTYNFANVIDDHLMNITDIFRGNEYLSSSSAKYNIVYQSFNWNIPRYYHVGMVTQNNCKMSKQDEELLYTYSNLIKEGYLKEAIINYIVFQ